MRYCTSPYIVEYSKKVKRSSWAGGGAGVQGEEGVVTKGRGVSVAVGVGVVPGVA